MNSPSDAQIENALRRYGVPSSPELSTQIRTYISLLLRWNRAVSLTTITDVDQILRFHFGESLFAIPAVSGGNGRLADVGSGAGFPGIPLAMALPSLKVTLIESSAKKFAFLSEVIRELRLANAVALRCRMEDINRPGQRFDIVTVRAIGQFGVLLKWSRRQLNPSGKIVLWLGDYDVKRLSTDNSWIWSLPVAIPDAERRFILSGSPKS